VFFFFLIDIFTAHDLFNYKFTIKYTTHILHQLTERTELMNDN